jgi:hypothetical protein
VKRIEVSGTIGLIKLSRIQRFLLQRRFIAFELRRIVAIYEEKPPKRKLLGVRRTRNLLFLFKTGEYSRGIKKILYLGPTGGKSVRILLLNPDFDEIYISLRGRKDLLALLQKYVSGPGRQR